MPLTEGSEFEELAEALQAANALIERTVDDLKHARRRIRELEYVNTVFKAQLASRLPAQTFVARPPTPDISKLSADMDQLKLAIEQLTINVAGRRS